MKRRSRAWSAPRLHSHPGRRAEQDPEAEVGGEPQEVFCASEAGSEVGQVSPPEICQEKGLLAGTRLDLVRCELQGAGTKQDWTSSTIRCHGCVTSAVESAIVNIDDADAAGPVEDVVDVEPDVGKHDDAAPRPTGAAMGDQRLAQPPVAPPVRLQQSRETARLRGSGAHHTARRADGGGLRVKRGYPGMRHVEAIQVDGQAVVRDRDVESHDGLACGADTQSVLHGVCMPGEVWGVRQRFAAKVRRAKHEENFIKAVHRCRMVHSRADQDNTVANSPMYQAARVDATTARHPDRGIGDHLGCCLLQRLERVQHDVLVSERDNAVAGLRRSVTQRSARGRELPLCVVDSDQFGFAIAPEQRGKRAAQAVVQYGLVVENAYDGNRFSSHAPTVGQTSTQWERFTRTQRPRSWDRAVSLVCRWLGGQRIMLDLVAQPEGQHVFH